ncbi:MAG: hypothetical protein AAGD07_03490 [Planctomycetota bacterium]
MVVLASVLNDTGFDRGGLWLLAGFVMLGWVMARLAIKRGKNRAHADRDVREMQRRFDRPNNSAVPLSDAPVETQRWQVAMFDLQRELKGELDSRIAVVQSLLRQVDQRIERLQSLQESTTDQD